jgi:hypothetical protein
MNNSLRRVITIAAWPFIDTALTIFSNLILLHWGVRLAIVATAVVMTTLNLLLFHLLSLEKPIQEWVTKKSRRISFLQKKIKSLEYGKTTVILLVFTISGPAMAGVPLLWLLGVKGRTAAVLIILGSTINSLLWVGGVYNIFWIVARDLIIRNVL